ncbi:hypothetical protein WJX72_002835 [[Myrmecia] bisecta]|uniref:Uncharacterized protein n=1 Tax=[Myrmecia] bisecta TaxID=41462 RepID=A0AAW1PG11_9CHLO
MPASGGRRPLQQIAQGAVYKRRKKTKPLEGELHLDRLFAGESPQVSQQTAGRSSEPAPCAKHAQSSTSVSPQHWTEASTRSTPAESSGRASSSRLDAGARPAKSWGLAREAQFFADLDAEELVEEEEPPSVVDERGVKQPDCTPAQQLQLRNKLPQTAVLLECHPAIEVQYKDYLESMGPKMTPMPIKDFCKALGKERWGVPVLRQ